MSNRDTQVTREYAEAVIRRGSDPRFELVPRSHNVDWGDQPSRYKIYFDVPRLPLPERLAPLGTLAATAEPPGAARRAPLEYTGEQLATLLRLSNGLLQRRLDINWNLDHTGRAAHAHSVYARPAASGGGMYPYELYLVTGRGRALLPGVYHYDGAHHALEQLAAGDVSHRVRAAVGGHPAGADAAYFVLVAVNFWKNYFKYHNFCYHVVTQDVGAQLAALRMAARGLGDEPTFLLWFEDEVLNRLLGLETEAESVFAVVALGRGAGAGGGAAAPRVAAGWRETPLTRARSFQRSKHIFRLPTLEGLHRSALVEGEPPPPAAEVASAGCAESAGDAPALPLPPSPPGVFEEGLREVFLKRGSSWGRMASHPPLQLPQLAALLRYAAAGQSYDCDVRSGDPAARLTRVTFFANHVRGLPAGAYSYDAAGGCLRCVGEGEYGVELQRRFFLENYNMEQAAVVFALVGRVEAAIRVFGNRGVRILNAEVGLVAQHVYMAAAALGVGCGAVLGFDNVAVNRLLGLGGSGQTSLLLLPVGPHRGGHGRFDFRLI